MLGACVVKKQKIHPFHDHYRKLHLLHMSKDRAERKKQITERRRLPSHWKNILVSIIHKEVNKHPDEFPEKDVNHTLNRKVS